MLEVSRPRFHYPSLPLQELDELFEQSADADAGVAEVKDEEVGSLFE